MCDGEEIALLVVASIAAIASVGPPLATWEHLGIPLAILLAVVGFPVCFVAMRLATVLVFQFTAQDTDEAPDGLWQLSPARVVIGILLGILAYYAAFLGIVRLSGAVLYPLSLVTSAVQGLV
jgi:hypothetical protein